MPPRKLGEKLLSWASEIDDVTLAQAQTVSRLPIVAGHVALMPDAHLGIGATIGSVIPTEGAVIPSAVGVDIGCGMVAVRTDLRAEDLPADLLPFLERLERAVPAGLGKWHRKPSAEARAWLDEHRPGTPLSPAQEAKAGAQLGTLGSGNHFLELCLDAEDAVWVILHSGSRGLGNQLATKHMSIARKLAERRGLTLEDPNLAFLEEGTPEFDRYVADMRWAQDYARRNRDLIVDAALAELFAFAGSGAEVERVNCHHNFTELEEHEGRTVWVTRKGAIRARAGELGLIAGSMGAPSYVVRGKGNPLSYLSCAHGAGRRHSRRQARKRFTTEELAKAMEGRTWLQGRAHDLLDESPSAYKDIDQVMADQDDLVDVLHVLRGIVNYKGV